MFIYGTPEDSWASQLVAGARVLGFAPGFRHPGFFSRQDTEPAGLIVVNEEAGRAKEIVAAYQEKRPETIAVMIGRSPLWPERMVKLYGAPWGGVPPFQCSSDRAEAMGLKLDGIRPGDTEVRIEGMVVGVASSPDEMPALRDFADRMAYALWSREELETGAALRWVVEHLNDMADTEIPDAVEAEPEAEYIEPEADQGPPWEEVETEAEAEEAIQEPEPVAVVAAAPEQPACDTEALAVKLWARARSKGMKKAELREYLDTLGPRTVMAELGLEQEEIDQMIGGAHE